MNYISTLINQIIVMFLLIGLGIFVQKKEMFSEKFIKELGTFLFTVVSPFMMINTYMIAYSSEKTKQVLLSFAIAAIIYLFQIVITKFVLGSEQAREERYAVVICNCGFFGLPVVLTVCGSDVGILVIPVITFNIILQMTYGNYIMSGDKKSISLKAILTNVNVIGSIIGIAFYFLRLPIIAPIKSTVSSLASLVAPISCFLIGVDIANTNIKAFFQDKIGFIAIGIRQILVPLVVIILLKFVSNDYYLLKLSLVIVFSTPPAAGTSVFARKFNKDYEQASRLVCVGTLLTLVTMPLMSTIATYIW